jgi:hypothetical protein
LGLSGLPGPVAPRTVMVYSVFPTFVTSLSMVIQYAKRLPSPLLFMMMHQNPILLLMATVCLNDLLLGSVVKRTVPGWQNTGAAVS